MNKKIKRNLLPCILIILGIIATMKMPYIQNGDELWTFSNTYKLYNGISLYNQNNIIVTPLFFWIGNIIFKLLGATFLTYRIYNVVLIFILYFVVNKILNLCNIKKEISILITICLMFLFYIINKVGADYTSLAIDLFLIGIYNLLKNSNKNINIIFQGIIVFLIFLTKQNIAVYYGIAVFVYLLTKNNKIKNIFLLGITFLISLIAFLGYEYYIGELYNFINYAVLGIGEFAQNNIILEGRIFTQVEIAFQISAIILGIMQLKENYNKKENDEKLKILFIFSFASIMLGYPIFNLYHVTTGMLIPSIMIIYIVSKFIKNISLDEESKLMIEKIIRTITIVVMAVLIILATKYLIQSYNLVNENTLFSSNDAFYGGVIDEEEYEYNDVMNYIKEKENEGAKVIIFDTRANLYMVPLGKNNQDYDLPMLGNWGKDGENRVLEKVKNEKNTYFLLYDETRNITTQESVKIKKYIKDNYNFVEDIGKYHIYYAE